MSNSQTAATSECVSLLIQPNLDGSFTLVTRDNRETDYTITESARTRPIRVVYELQYKRGLVATYGDLWSAVDFATEDFERRLAQFAKKFQRGKLAELITNRVM